MTEHSFNLHFCLHDEGRRCNQVGAPLASLCMCTIPLSNANWTSILCLRCTLDVISKNGPFNLNAKSCSNVRKAEMKLVVTKGRYAPDDKPILPVIPYHE